jgi:hypothetical protein
MKTLSFVMLATVLSFSSCSHTQKSCCKDSQKQSCGKDTHCNKDKKSCCKDGKCEKTGMDSKQCCTGDHCEKSKA